VYQCSEGMKPKSSAKQHIGNSDDACCEQVTIKATTTTTEASTTTTTIKATCATHTCSAGMKTNPDATDVIIPPARPGFSDADRNIFDGICCKGECFTEPDPPAQCDQHCDECQVAMHFAKTEGIIRHPDWYASTPGLTAESPYRDFQAHIAGLNHPQGCKMPCAEDSSCVDATTASVEQFVSSQIRQNPGWAGYFAGIHTCSQLKSHEYRGGNAIDFCINPYVGDEVRRLCPRSCGTCSA
jgi:hypothetical protein